MTEEEVIASLIGRTVVAAQWSDGGSGPLDCGEAATLTLDDGRIIRFGGYGLHTDGGATVDDITDEDE